MACLLVWNVAGKHLGGCLATIAEEYGVGVVILLECPPNADSYRLGLRMSGAGFMELPSKPGFGIFHRPEAAALGRFEFASIFDSPRFDLLRLAIPGCPEMALAIVHGLDRWNHPDGDDRKHFLRLVRNAVESTEEQIGHRRSIIAGDFNANPFEAEIGSTEGLHAIRVRSVRGKTARNVGGQTYRFFHNPSWTCLAPRSGNPPGSYFHYNYRAHEIFWHALDQVVVRPDVLPYFDDSRLTILARAGETSLLNHHGEPDDRIASNHLPLIFTVQPSPR